MWGQGSRRCTVVVEEFPTIGPEKIWRVLRDCFDAVRKEYAITGLLTGREGDVNATVQNFVNIAEAHAEGHAGLLFAARGSLMCAFTAMARERTRGDFSWHAFRVAIYGMQELVRAMLCFSDSDRAAFCEGNWNGRIQHRSWRFFVNGALASAQLIFALDCYKLHVTEPSPEVDGRSKIDYIVSLEEDGDEIALQLKSSDKTEVRVVGESASRDTTDEGAFSRGVFAYQRSRRACTGNAELCILPVLARVKIGNGGPGAPLMNNDLLLGVRNLMRDFLEDVEVVQT